MKLLLLAMMAVAISVPVQGKQSAAPIAPGLYCLKEPMTGYTGTGKDIPLGDFIGRGKQEGRTLRRNNSE